MASNSSGLHAEDLSPVRVASSGAGSKRRRVSPDEVRAYGFVLPLVDPVGKEEAVHAIEGTRKWLIWLELRVVAEPLTCV